MEFSASYLINVSAIQDLRSFSESAVAATQPIII
jgi:hypothetical protein